MIVWGYYSFVSAVFDDDDDEEEEEAEVVRNVASYAWGTYEEVEVGIWNSKNTKEVEEGVPFLVAEASASTWTLVLNVEDLNYSSKSVTKEEEARCFFVSEEAEPWCK